MKTLYLAPVAEVYDFKAEYGVCTVSAGTGESFIVVGGGGFDF